MPSHQEEGHKRERDWLGQTQKKIGNVPKEERDPRAKKRKRCYRVCNSWVVMESMTLNLLDIEKYTK